MILESRKNLVFIVLAMFFAADAIVAEMIGGKLITVGPFTLSIGVIPWPVVFIMTDVINEYYGRKGVRRLSLITACLIIYAYIILFFAMHARAASFSPVQDDVFQKVFGQSMWIIVGSIIAFLTSQLTDNYVFWWIRDRTGEKMIWLRSTGSTLVSQLVDTFIVCGIGLYLPALLHPEQYEHPMTGADYLSTAATAYVFKVCIAISATPLIYIVHGAIDRYIGRDEAERTIKHSAEESLHHKVES